MTYECALCGAKRSAELMIFSRHTRLRYCRDFAACDRRARQASGRAVDAGKVHST